MRTPVGILIVASVVLLAACRPMESQSQQAVAPAPAAAPAVEPFATTRQIMLGITIPTSDAVFQVGAKAPEDDLAWEKVQANAASLAESANLLQTGPRVQDQGDWLKWCQELRRAAEEAAKAAQAKDVDKVLAAGDQIYEVCDSCHKKYMAARGGV